MQEIPSESRLRLLPYARGVIRALTTTSTTARMHTMKTRQLHFIKWCLNANLSDPTFKDYDLKQRNFLMACYAISLTSNQSIYCKIIKSSTVSTYLSDAAKLSIMNKLHDPTKDVYNQRSQFITNVINEHKR